MVRTLNYLILAGTALLSVRLYWLRLRPKYKAFFYYLIFSTLQTGFMMQLDNSWRGKVYPYAYVATEPIGWVFYVLVVLELYSLVLADYQGLYTVGRWGLFIGVTMALLASSLSLLVPSHGPPQGSRILPYYYVVERAVYLSLVVFLITILLVLLQYPITLKRNIVVHSVVFSIYFLFNTTVYSLLSLRGFASIAIVRYTLLGVTLASLGAWLVSLDKAGENSKVRLRPSWMPGKEEQLVSQLNSLNAALLRATRK
jgi:hypothetical protein